MKYRTAYDVADTAVRDLSRQGWEFKKGAVRNAALAAVPFKDSKDICEAIQTTLKNQTLSASGGYPWGGPTA